MENANFTTMPVDLVTGSNRLLFLYIFFLSVLGLLRCGLVFQIVVDSLRCIGFELLATEKKTERPTDRCHPEHKRVSRNELKSFERTKYSKTNTIHRSSNGESTLPAQGATSIRIVVLLELLRYGACAASPISPYSAP